MASYLTLFQFRGTVKGGGPERFNIFKGIIEELGGKLVFFGGLMGEHDVMIITNYPSLKAATLGAARIGNLINAKSTSSPIIDEADFLELLAQTPRE